MPPNAPRRPARRSSGGGFWLGLAIIVGGIAAVYVFAPDLPRRLLAGKDVPPTGEEPALAQSSQTALEVRETNAVDSQLTKPSEVVRTATGTKPVTDKPDVAAAPIKNAYADEAKAQALLAEAEAAYAEAPAAKNWSKAVSKARAITSLAAKPATLVRAQDIVKGSQAMEKLFKDLDDRDELARNFETHPSLVMLIDGPNPSQAVPIRSMDDQTVVDGDPVAWLQAQRRTGSITVLLRGKKDFLPAKIPADHVGKIEKADVAITITEKRSEFDERLARLKNSDLANNALAWYDAAKFAYQNRIDDRVAAMMDKALVLDPRLASSVREDKAAGLFATLVLHLNNGNVKQAAPFMAIIDKRFDDTPSGVEARAFYDLKTKQNAEDVAAAQTALRQAREDARLRAKEEADRRRTERVERAKQLGDEEAVKVAEREHDDVGTTEMGAPPTGDESKADELFQQGKEAYQKALDAGNTSNRDGLYHEAQKHLTAAQNIYNALLDKRPDDAVLGDKAFMCNKLRYGSIKQQRFH